MFIFPPPISKSLEASIWVRAWLKEEINVPDTPLSASYPFLEWGFYSDGLCLPASSFQEGGKKTKSGGQAASPCEACLYVLERLLSPGTFLVRQKLGKGVIWLIKCVYSYKMTIHTSGWSMLVLECNKTQKLWWVYLVPWWYT